jgi:hypothetical protein
MTVSLSRSEAVIQLGKALVERLGDSEDILSAWMAHDIAALMDAAQTAAAAGRGAAAAAAAAACRTAVLELWAHRNDMPAHLQPLRELEPILRTLAYLALDQEDFRYFPPALRAAATAGAEGEAKSWLDLALGLDDSARTLVRFALRNAALHAAANTAPWVTLAQQAGAAMDREALPIRLLVTTDEPADRKELQALGAQIKRLEGFIQSAAVLADHLKRTVEDLKPGEAPKAARKAKRTKPSPKA